jgi:hypothetical protein
MELEKLDTTDRANSATYIDLDLDIDSEDPLRMKYR